MLKVKFLFLIFIWFLVLTKTSAQSKIANKFDTVSFKFKGTKPEQARYLLRFVQKYGNIGDTLKNLPPFIDSIVNDNVKLVRKRKLQRYLNQENLLPIDVGGSIDSAICSVEGNGASYFVIHDTSNFLADSTSFPNNLDSVSWKGNRLDNKLTFKYTHLFINRLGNSITSNDMSKAVRGTKFENPAKNPLINKNILGTFIHIEVIQPRIADPGKKNDAIAINPGFTEAQYKRLALLYIVASFRKGEWLIPTFHAVLDDGIFDGHDDPQNFELEKFDALISSVFHQITK